MFCYNPTPIRVGATQNGFFYIVQQSATGLTTVSLTLSLGEGSERDLDGNAMVRRLGMLESLFHAESHSHTVATHGNSMRSA